MTRWALFAIGLLGSIAVTALLWWMGLPGFFLFLLLPPLLLLRPRASRRCPACSFSSSDPDVKFCPRDGTRMA